MKAALAASQAQSLLGAELLRARQIPKPGVTPCGHGGALLAAAQAGGPLPAALETER